MKHSITRMVIVAAVAATLAFQAPSALAESDPFPGVGEGGRIPGGPFRAGTAEETPPSPDSLGCPSGSRPATETWTASGRWEQYCTKSWVSPEVINDEANRAAAEAAARAQAQAEAEQRPGTQVCKTWSYTYSNGISTASGGVCTVVPVVTGGVDVPDPTPSSEPAPTPTRPADPDLSREPWYLYEPNYVPGSCGLTVTVSGSGYSYTRPFSANECAQRDIDSRVWQAMSLARERAQAEALARPGLRICTPWTAAGVSGQECALEPLRGADQPGVSVVVTPIVADPSIPLNLTPGWERLAPGIVAGDCGLTVTETITATGVTFTRPYSTQECLQRALDIASHQASSQAAAVSEAAARRSPGVEICTPWTAGSQSGRECRMRPIGLDTVISTNETDADLTIADGEVVAENEGASLSPAEQVARTTMAVFQAQLLSTQANQAARSALMKGARLIDASVPRTIAPGRSVTTATVEGLRIRTTSMTPAICRVSARAKVTAIKQGTCILSFEFSYRTGQRYRLGQTMVVAPAIRA